MLNLKQSILSLVILPAICLIDLGTRSHSVAVATSGNFNSNVSEPMTMNRDLANEQNACREYSGGFVLAKTKRFYIEICGDRTKPMSYYISGKNVGDSKRAAKVLDIQSYSFDPLAPNDLERFIAVDGNTQYILTQTSTIVKQNNRVVSIEPNIYYKRLR